MGFEDYPSKYLLFNQRATKQFAIVMEIEGVDDKFGISDTYTYIRYGDPGIVYGEAGVIYGGLRRLTNVKPYIILQSSLVIQQTIEPEQGRASVGTLTLTLIDPNGEVSQYVAPGLVIDEIIGKREVKIYLGFQQSSFPEDYLLVYRGYITQVMLVPGQVQFQISDSTAKKRQPIFNQGTTVLTASIDAVQTNIPVVSSVGMYQQILGPDNTYDPIVRTYINIDSEWMEYGSSGLAPTTITVQRGGSHSLGSATDVHASGTSVANGVQLGGNTEGENALTLALKIMLSGWNGPCETNIPILSFVWAVVPSLDYITNAFVLNGIDAKKDLGLTAGDYFTISGASVGGNNISGVILDFDDAVTTNSVIYTDQTFSLENPTSAVVAFRSKYDTLPVACGLSMRMRDVDVDQWEYVRRTFFNSATSANMQFFFSDSTDGKTLIDTLLLLPIGCYGISRFGRCSVSITKPPLPGGSTKILTVDQNNLIDPDKIQIHRATNDRNFFNLVTYTYDKSPLDQSYGTIDQFLDTDSLNLFSLTSELPITADGLSSQLGGATIAQTRGTALLTRYKKCAVQLTIKVNWSVGSLIEVSDIVMIKDNGTLKIFNFETGERDLGGAALFEVIDRQYDIMNGIVTLGLLGGLGFNLTNRFGLISPSSTIGMGSTNQVIRITPSYGQTSLFEEMKKWKPFVGMTIRVHSYDWSVNGTGTINSFSDSDPAAIILSAPLGFTPSAGQIVDVPKYPTTTNKNDDLVYKNLYAHITPTIAVTSGVSGTQFNVSSGDASKLTVGNSVILRNSDFSTISAEIAIQSVSGTLVTLAKTLGFTPDNTYTVEGIGFPDGTSFYRYV